MDEKKALSTLSLLQSVYTKDAYQALQLAMDDIIKAFIEQRREQNEDSKH